MMQNFEVRKCNNPACGIRYTLPELSEGGKRCPVCRSEADQIGDKFVQHEVPEFVHLKSIRHLEVLLDNIRSAWNVGAILRASDGAGVNKVHLSGVSPMPDQIKVAKTALGAQRTVPWEYHKDGVLACHNLLSTGFRVWALEGGQRAENLFQAKISSNFPVLLVVGNELTGIDPGILALCERVFCLPMMGSKGSLNVAVAFATAVYTLNFCDQCR
jgi:23S rRNA (guanosine2251-2'-O)-methyltransferase